MTALVTKHIALLSDAPSGVEKLRMLFRRLAVSGRLSTSAANDSTQTVWRAATFGQVFSLEYGDNLPAPKRSGTGEFPVYGSNGVVGSHNECCVNAPCIVVGRKGSAGAVNICEHEGCWVTDVAYSCVPPDDVALRFAFVLFLTLGLDELGKGIKPGLSRSEAYALPVSIPPLAEQHRIVAKVDELMSLCDRLEAEQADAEAAHAQLVQALLASLTQARDAADFRASWQLLSKNFHALFNTTDDINLLKRVLIDLAIRGILTSTAMEIGAEAPCSKLAEAEKKPYKVPKAWTWFLMEEVVAFQGGSQPPKSVFVYEPRPGYTRLVQIRDFKSEANQTFIPTEKANRPFNEDDVMIGRYGPPVFQILRGLSGTYNVALMKASPMASNLSKDFLFWLLQETRIHDTVVRESERTAGQTGIRLPLLYAFAVAIPPLEAQQKIVSKLEQLMSLCEQLKLSLAKARLHHEHLASVLVEQAVD